MIIYLFDIETISVSESTLCEVVEINKTMFAIVGFGSFYEGIYLRSGVVITDTKSSTPNGAKKALINQVWNVPKMFHVLNEMNVQDYCETNGINYPVNDLEAYEGQRP